MPLSCSAFVCTSVYFLCKGPVAICSFPHVFYIPCKPQGGLSLVFGCIFIWKIRVVQVLQTLWKFDWSIITREDHSLSIPFHALTLTHFTRLHIVLNDRCTTKSSILWFTIKFTISPFTFHIHDPSYSLTSICTRYCHYTLLTTFSFGEHTGPTSGEHGRDLLASLLPL